jgi:hypothetical protein
VITPAERGSATWRRLAEDLAQEALVAAGRAVLLKRAAACSPSRPSSAP